MNKNRNLLPLHNKLNRYDFGTIAYVLKWALRTDKYRQKWAQLAPSQVPKTEVLLSSAQDVLKALKNDGNYSKLEMLVEKYLESSYGQKGR